MAMNAELLANEVVEAIASTGAFDKLSPEDAAQQRAITRAAWAVIAGALIEHLQENAVVTIPSGATVLDGVVSEQTGSIT